MNVLLMGLSVFAVILASFFVVKGIPFFSRGKSARPMRSGWVPLQVYSGDDCLGHPDLQKISELRGDRRRAE